MAGRNGPTSAAGTPETPNPDGGAVEKPGEGGGNVEKKDEAEEPAPQDQNEDG